MPDSQIEAVVHVGLPKTGSTAIQRFLALNATVLAERGLRVPSPRIDRFSQLEYGLAAFDRAGRMVEDEMLRNRHGLASLSDQRALVRPFEEDLEARLAEVSGQAGARFVMSSEHIGAWMQDGALRGALDGWLSERFSKVRYIMFVRPQANFVLSSYSESVKRGSARTLAEFVRDYDEIDVASTIRDWQADFGARARIAMMPGADAGADGLLRRFCVLAEIDPDGLEMPQVANEALSARAAEALRRANAVIGKDTQRNLAQRAVFAGLRKGAMALWAKGPRLTLDDDQTRMIAARYPQAVEDLLAEQPDGPR